MNPSTFSRPALRTWILALALGSGAASAFATVSAGDVSAPYGVEPQFRLLRFGEVMPKGWIREQMIRDLDGGFAGHMPQIAPFTCASDIFGANRNTPARYQNAGGGSWGGAEGMWWKGETEGNWRSGNTMMSLLTGLPAQRAHADAMVAEILRTQDPDGYIGIYGPTIRWPAGKLDNGELWAQTTVFRGLLAYYEATGKKEVLQAVEKAVQLSMSHYAPGGKTDPYGPGTQDHNLMFVDVMERLYDLTGNTAYRDFGVYLYRDYSMDVKTDISLSVLLAQDHPFLGHGATTYEQLRVPMWAGYVTGDPVLLAAGEEGFAKTWPHVSPTGGPVSDEFIDNKPTDPNRGGYEGCGEKEWMTSLLTAAQLTGRAVFAEQAETTFYNSVQGSRLSDGKGMNYVTTDNIYRIDGANMNRVKSSPAHEDVANCCAPNFTQIGPIFVRNMWMRSPDGLALVLHGPSEVNTTVNGVAVHLAEDTSYPFSDTVAIHVDPASAVTFTLHVRVPDWATSIDSSSAGAEIHRAGDWLLVEKNWQPGDVVNITFGAEVKPVPATNGEFYVQRGPLFYVVAIPADRKSVKDYPLPGFHDYHFFPIKWGDARYALLKASDSVALTDFKLVPDASSDPRFPYDGAPARLTGQMTDLDSMTSATVALVPIGSSEAVLRRATFPATP